MGDSLLRTLRPGDVVEALCIPKDVVDVPAGTLGVVFHEAEYHEPNTGPMVRFIMGGRRVAACNVYSGWVRLVAV